MCLYLCQMLSSEKQKLYGAVALGVISEAVVRNAVLVRLGTDIDSSQPPLILGSTWHKIPLETMLLLSATDFVFLQCREYVNGIILEQPLC